MNDRSLQQLVEAISTESFGRPFRHRATFNHRLRTTGGRYLLESHNVELNPRVWELYGEQELIKVIKHELCHYHLHLENKGYRHQDAHFKELLAQTGGSRYVPNLLREHEKARLLMYRCQDCGQEYVRRKKINTRRFVCGKCQGKLALSH